MPRRWRGESRRRRCRLGWWIRGLDCGRDAPRAAGGCGRSACPPPNGLFSRSVRRPGSTGLGDADEAHWPAATMTLRVSSRRWTLPPSCRTENTRGLPTAAQAEFSEAQALRGGPVRSRAAIALGIDSGREREHLAGIELDTKAAGSTALDGDGNTSFCRGTPPGARSAPERLENYGLGLSQQSVMRVTVARGVIPRSEYPAARTDKRRRFCRGENIRAP